MTLSLHHSAPGFFPGTGYPPQKFAGKGAGRGYSLNFPFKAGANDDTYREVFVDILLAAVSRFKPKAIVLQCGADTIVGDPLAKVARYNLSLRGHAYCVEAVKSLNIPLVVLGGGGYAPANVAKCWAYDTSVICNTPVGDCIPECVYRPYLGKSLVVRSNGRVKDQNDTAYLHSMREQLYEVLNECKKEC
jgi:histone deacetylase 1/2